MGQKKIDQSDRFTFHLPIQHTVQNVQRGTERDLMPMSDGVLKIL